MFSHKFFFIFFYTGLCLIGPFTFADQLENNVDETVEELTIVKQAPGPTISLTNISSKNIEQALMPLRQMSEKELLAHIKENTKNSQAAPILAKFPLITVFMVRLMQDHKALPNLAKILENKARLTRYAYWMLGTFVLGFILGRIMRLKHAGIFLAVFLWFFRFSVMMAVRLGVTYYFFSNELDPTLKVFSKTFF